MLLTITTSARPATDLGFLLHKNPAAVRSVNLSFGTAHVFYTEATEARCTAALLLEVDPVALVRGRHGGAEGTMDQYVNDRPYVGSSFLSVAIAQVYGTALGGRSKDRPELAATAIPLEARIAALPCRGGEELLRRLFEPLGYEIAAERAPLDERFHLHRLRDGLRHSRSLVSKCGHHRQRESGAVHRRGFVLFHAP